MEKGMVHGTRVPQALEDLVQPHVDSFDYFLGEGMQHVLDNYDPIEVRFSHTNMMRK